jgi:hypothetical protein
MRWYHPTAVLIFVPFFQWDELVSGDCFMGADIVAGMVWPTKGFKDHILTRFIVFGLRCRCDGQRDRSIDTDCWFLGVAGLMPCSS